MGGVLASVSYLTPAQILNLDIIENFHNPQQQMPMEAAAFRGFIFDDSEIEIGYTWETTSVILITDNFGNPQRYIFSERNGEIDLQDD